MKAILLLIIVFLVLFLGIVIGAQNNQPVVLNYLLAQAQMSLASVMAIMLLVGVLLSSALYAWLWTKLSWRIAQLKKRQKRQQRHE